MNWIGLANRAKMFALRWEGSVATITAIMLPAILGIGAIAFDMGSWYLDRRSMQTAADGAAITAAWALTDGKSASEAVALGVANAASNGYGTANGSTVNIAVDTTTGHATASISRNADLYLSRVILSAGDIGIGVSATAGEQDSEPVCLLALQGFNSGVTVNGGATPTDVDATNCSIQSNSSDATALDTNGTNGWITANSVCANYSTPPTGSNIPNATPSAYYCPPLLSPFSHQLTPEWDGTADNCPTQMAPAPTTTNGVTTLYGGCYVNNNLQINNSLQFETGGVFYFYNSSISLAGGGNDATGKDITIFLYGTSTIDVGGARNLDLEAKPVTDPDYPNILIVADASNSADLTGGQSGDSKFGGTSSAILIGIIYLPGQDVRIGGTADTVATDATIVTNTVSIVGSGSFSISAPDNGNTKRRTVMLLK